MKQCSTCKTIKPVTDFHARKASKDGLTSSCKTCLKERDANRYHKEKQTRTSRHKEYMRTPEGRAAHAKAVEGWKARNKVRHAANVILGNAVRSGRVTRMPCWVCGQKAEAHHPDYDRPLDVVWFCPAHHKQAHAASKE